jgi:hypothetical protein
MLPQEPSQGELAGKRERQKGSQAGRGQLLQLDKVGNTIVG